MRSAAQGHWLLRPTATWLRVSHHGGRIGLTQCGIDIHIPTKPMNSDELLASVLAPAPAQVQQQRLLALLDQPYAEAETLPTETERRNAHLGHVLRTKVLIEALVGPQLLARAANRQIGSGGGGLAPAKASMETDDVPETLQRLQLAHLGGTYFFSLLERVRKQYRHRVERRDFCETDCGIYPWRDSNQGELHVRPIGLLSAASARGRRYEWSEVAPYADAGVSESARAARYRSQLRVRQITRNDLQPGDDGALVGQRGVFARQRVAAGTCVGVYGGQVLDRADVFILQDDRYLISASSSPGEKGINGENMMAIMNTFYLRDAQGKLAGHPPGGYSVEPAVFNVETLRGEPLLVHAFFATRDIEPGEELRWNYGSQLVSVQGDVH